jgi:hypothetical protein
MAVPWPPAGVPIHLLLELTLVPTRKNKESSDCPSGVPIQGPQSLLHMIVLVHIAELG